MSEIVVPEVTITALSFSTGASLCDDTVADVIERARLHLETGSRDELNRLNASISDTTTEAFDLTYELGSVSRGSLVSIGLEDILIWDINETAKRVTGSTRGHAGSLRSVHAADATVRVNAAFTDWQIFRAMNEELADLSSPRHGVFAVKQVDLTYNASIRAYDLVGTADDLGDILQIKAKTTSPNKEWAEITSWRIDRAMPTADFPSGRALVLHAGGTHGQTVRVWYKAPFVQLTAINQVVATVTGLSCTALPILSVGAALKLLAGQPVRRADYRSQGGTRRAEEVTVGDTLSAPAGLRALHDSLVAGEADRLAGQWPQMER